MPRNKLTASPAPKNENFKTTSLIEACAALLLDRDRARSLVRRAVSLTAASPLAKSPSDTCLARLCGCGGSIKSRKVDAARISLGLVARLIVLR